MYLQFNNPYNCSTTPHALVLGAPEHAETSRNLLILSCHAKSCIEGNLVVTCNKTTVHRTESFDFRPCLSRKGSVVEHCRGFQETRNAITCFKGL